MSLRLDVEAQVVRRTRFVVVALILSYCLLAIGCGGSSKTTGTGPSGLQFTAPTQAPSVDAGQTVTLTVNQPVTWSLTTAFGNPVGQLKNPGNTTVTYTTPDPSTLAASAQVTVIATLVSDTTQSAAMPILINLPPSAHGGTLSGNQSCQYDPLNNVGQSNGTVGVVYPVKGNTPQVSNGTGPYTWTVNSGNLPAGLSLGSTGTNTTSNAFLVGTPVTPGCSQISLQVTDAAGLTATTSTFFIIITPPPLNIQVPNIAAAYPGIPYAPTAVSVSGGTPPYKNWRLSPFGDLMPPGMVLTVDASNPAAAIVSGTPESGNSLLTFSPTLQVEDSQSPYPAVGGAGLSFFVWPALPTNSCMPAQGGTANTNLSSMKGSYAFLLRGFDANGPVVMAGSFAADGAGNVTGGVEDVMRTTGSQNGAAITGGSYAVLQQNDNSTNTFEQSGCLSLTTSAGTTTFALSMAGCSTSQDLGSGVCLVDAQNAPGLYTTGRLSENDDTTGTGTRGSGIVRLQDSSAFAGGLSGAYAFGLSGWDAIGSRMAAAGSFTASSSALSSVAADVNDGGVLQSALTGGTGSLSALDTTTGRGTASLTAGSVTLGSLAVYAVSAKEAFVVSTGAPGATNPFVGGEAISAAGPFNVASLQNSHIFHVAGLSSAGPDPSIGILHFDGVGGFSGTEYEDQAGTIGSTTPSGNYAVDGNSGRLMFATQTVLVHPLVGYVVPVSTTLTRQSCSNPASCVTGFLISTDATAQAGLMEFQTPTVAPPPPFSKTFVAGYYVFGSDEELDPTTPIVSGVAKANPNGTSFAGIQSASYSNSSYCQQPNCALLVSNETFGGKYSVNSDGSGTIGGETISVTNGNVIFYIDESPLDTHPSVIVVEQ